MAYVARIAVEEEQGGHLAVHLLSLLNQEHVQLGPVPDTHKQSPKDQAPGYRNNHNRLPSYHDRVYDGVRCPIIRMDASGWSV